jgi:hypothetical protein
MAITLQVVGKTGTVKKIAATYLKRTMASDAGWFESHAATVALNDFLTIADQDYLILEAGKYVELKFGADSGLADGQGTTSPFGLSETKVTAVTGTGKGLRAADATQATKKTEAYSSASAFTIAVNDILASGDMAVCNKTGTFTLRFTAFDKGGPYAAIPAVKIYTSDN